MTVAYSRQEAMRPKSEAYYSEYYENDILSLKEMWKRAKEFIITRYKLFTDKKATQTEQKNRVRDQLLDVGLHKLDLIKPETFYITKIIEPNENVKAAVCGHVDDSSTGLLIITDSRIIYLNQIPLFTTIDEMGYGAVQGVNIEIGQFDATITLNTGIKNFVVHHVNLDAANKFVDVAERIAVFNSGQAISTNSQAY